MSRPASLRRYRPELVPLEPRETPSASTLDPTFGFDGISGVSFPRLIAHAQSLAFQSDGKIIMVGSNLGNVDSEIAIARLNVDGSLDTTFGTNGRRSFDLGQDESAFSVALQADGKILVGGYAVQAGVRKFAILRLNSDGSNDLSFDTDGVLLVAAGANATVRKIAPTTGGKIVVAGDADKKTIVMQFLGTGAIDPGFGIAGTVSWNQFGDRAVAGLKVFGDGRILVGSTAVIAFGTPADFDISQVFEKVNANGTPDLTFGGGDGQAAHLFRATAFGSVMDDMEVAGDGKIVTIGNNHAFRYNADGTRDTSFDTDGVVRLAVFADYERTTSLSIESNGKIFIVGEKVPGDTFSYLTVARYNVNGSLDFSFDVDGWKMYKGGSDNVSPMAVRDSALDSVGRLVVVGNTAYDVFPSFLAVRIGDPPPVTVALQGTAGNDIFRVSSDGTNKLNVQIDNVMNTTYELDAFLNLSFDGLGGEDKVYFYDFHNPIITTLIPLSVSNVTAAGKYRVSFWNTEYNQSFGKVNDLVYLYDSPGDDRFVATGVYANMKGPGYENNVITHSAVYGISSAGGTDKAYLYDSSNRPAANDTFIATPTYAQLKRPGTFTLQASGFDEVTGYSTGGSDSAILYGSLGADVLSASPTAVTLAGTSYKNLASAFDRVEIFGGAGKDRGTFTGSSGVDTFDATQTKASLKGTGFANTAFNFEEISVAGGVGDVAKLVGSIKADSLVVTPTRTQFTGPNFDYRLTGFKTVDVNGGMGADTAYLRDSAGNDTLTASSTSTTLKTPTQTTTLKSFSKVTAQRSTGIDVANVGSLNYTLILWGGWVKKKI